MAIATGMPPLNQKQKQNLEHGKIRTMKEEVGDAVKYRQSRSCMLDSGRSSTL